MPYYSSPGNDQVDDYDEFDPTPYGGGYDLFLTYGRPLDPCDETCYPSSHGDFDYARPHFSSSSDHCAYADEALQTEYSSYARPKPRPGSAYGGGPGGHGVHNEPGNGRRPEYEQSESGHYGRKPEFEQPASGFESEYGRKPEFEQPHRRPEYGEHGSEYGRKAGYGESESEYGSGYGRKSEYEGGGPEYGTGHRRMNEGEYGSGYGDKTETGYGSSYGRNQSYGREEYGGERSEYERKPSYGRSEEEEGGYRKPSYERKDDNSDDENRKSYGYGGEKGYGRKKYEGDNSDDDEEKKHHRYERHHNKRHDDY